MNLKMWLQTRGSAQNVMKRTLSRKTVVACAMQNVHREACGYAQTAMRKTQVMKRAAECAMQRGHVQAEMEIDFKELYLKFSEDEDFDIRYCAATSLHEAFSITTDDEDTSKLR